MGSNPLRQLHRTILWISALCIAGAGLSAHFLYLDFTSVGRDGVGEPVAKVRHFESKVRRKAMGGYTWRNIEVSQSLYRKDSVQTGPLSVASLELKDGTTIELGEQSLIVLDDTQDLALQFLRGNAVIRRADGDAKISVDSDGTTKLEKLPIRAVGPGPYAEIFTVKDAAKQVAFRWVLSPARPDSPEESLTLEISDRASFPKASTRIHSVKGKSEWQVLAELPPGRHHWRVMREGEPWITARSFQISNALALSPTGPAPDATHTRWASSGAVTFRWNPPTATTSTAATKIVHRLQIARDPSFKTLVKDEPVDALSGSAQMSDLTDGTWFWRLSSAFPEQPVTSDIRKLTLQPRPAIGMRLLSPEPNATIENRVQLRFVWDGDLEPEMRYHWELTRATASGAPEVVSEVKTADSGAIWNVVKGRYQWRVTAKLRDRTVGTSAWQRITVLEGRPVVLQAPANDAKLLYWEKPEPFELVWSRKDSTEEQDIFEIATDATFTAGLISRKVSGFRISSADFTLAPGQYHWRVKRLDSDGLLLKTSSTFTFQHGQYPLLAGPRIIEPDVGRVYNPLAKEERPRLRWKAVEGATAYEVVIYRPNERPNERQLASTEVFQKVTLKETGFELKGLQQEGTYRWSVRAVDRISRPGEESEPTHFVFTYGARLKAPKIKTPEVQ